MSRTPRVRITNRLIARLQRSDREHLLAGCEAVELRLGEVLYEPGERIRHVYFPGNGFVSLLTPRDGCTSLEVGLVGAEGVLGATVLLGVDASPLRALVQGGGGAMRMESAPFVREFGHSADLRRTLNSYLYVSLAQLARTAACTHFHLLEARLARWLLMTHDRAQADEFVLTHELLAQMLGVRRVGVTKAAGALQRRKLIRYHRGRITVLARAGLEAASCACYRNGQDIYDRVMTVGRA